MSQWVDIPLATQEGEDVNSSYASDMELVNLMLKDSPPGSRKPFHIAHAPGLDTTSAPLSPSTSLIRGACMRSDGFWFVVFGTDVYFCDPSLYSFAKVPSGTMPGTGPCRMVDAETAIVAVDTAGNTRVIDESASTAPSREAFADVTYQDGITVFVERGTDSVYAGKVGDPATIDALNFTTADALAGTCIGVASDHREVFVFKQKSIEYYFNSGGSGFPFTRGSPGIIQRGCWPTGRLAIKEFNRSLIFVGDDLRVYRMQGYQPTVISTPWVNAQIRAGITASAQQLYGSVFVLDGRPYYALSGLVDPSDSNLKTTYICDLDRQLWHRWAHPSVTDILSIDYDPRFRGSTFNNLVAANRINSVAVSAECLLNPSDPREFGTNRTHTMTMPQIDYGGVRSEMYEFYIDMQKTSDTPTLSWSDDGGTTYSSGTAAAASQLRTKWARLGGFFTRILRLVLTGSDKIAILGARAKISVGQS